MQYPFRKMKKRNYFENTFSYFMMYKSIVIIFNDLSSSFSYTRKRKEKKNTYDYMTFSDLVKKKLLKYCYFF